MSLKSVRHKKFDQIRFLIMNGLIAKYTPLDWYLFEIDNWFDSKWLGFSGKSLGALGIWKGDTTIPPFNPNRIRRSARFKKTDKQGEDYYKKANQPDHIHISQASGENLNRKITQFSDDGIFIWYSSNSENNDFGSILIYLVCDKEIRQVYICLKDNKKQTYQDSEWILHKAIGVTSQEIDRLIETGKTNKILKINEL